MALATVPSLPPPLALPPEEKLRLVELLWDNLGEEPHPFLTGEVDENHRLTAEVPESVPAEPVTLLIVPASQEDDAGDAWMAGVANEWSVDLNDERQDIYTIADGEPVRES